MASSTLRVVILKPGKYDPEGWVERFRRGFMPNTTVRYVASLTPPTLDGVAISVEAIDEYVQTDLSYLERLQGRPGDPTLVALVGVQSHQFHRALDLAAYAVERGAAALIGGPHAMTCDTAEVQGCGVSFALSEAELVWPSILRDAARGPLAGVYGADRRWQERLEAPVLSPPSRADLARYVVPMLGVYPARGCPYSCSFCSVIKIAGHRIRSQPIETTLATLRAAKAAGVRLVLFTSDNFNKYPEVEELLEAMIAERIELPFFAQCDAQIERQPDLVELLARAGCFQIFVGVESFSVEALRDLHKFHNTPGRYGEIVRLCREFRVTSHFASILGFPTDTEESIRDHLEALRALSPDVASFNILTPIPGTEQYDDFRSRDWITEKNLDRFDGTAATWRHPHLSGGRLADRLFDCYRAFYGWADSGRRFARFLGGRRDFRTRQTLFAIAGHAALARLAVRSRIHPFAGGVGRVRLDRAEDYRDRRRRRFQLDLVSLPESLALGPTDAELNRTAKLAAY
jgi:Radical SAM superfamily